MHVAWTLQTKFPEIGKLFGWFTFLEDMLDKFWQIC